MGRTANDPRITVIGVYSPKASPERLEQFIREYLSRTKETLAAMGTKASDSDKRWAEMAGELRSALRSAVLVEALVENRDDRFNPGDFVQPDPEQPKGQGQVAWEEVFLTQDGEKARQRETGLSEDRTFRIAFYIHLWKHGQPLLSSYGPLHYPQLTPVPARLWRLAPYALVD